MELLLKGGVAPDPGSPREVPALVAAVNAGQLTAAGVLLKAGASVSARHPESGKSSIDAATLRGDAAMLNLLEHPPAKP